MHRITNEQIETLKRQVEDLKQRWPFHSVPPSLIADLDDAEEELARLVKILQGNWEEHPSPSMLMAQLDEIGQELKSFEM
jgi:hypothetical protein